MVVLIAYDYFDQNIRSLPKDQDGQFDLSGDEFIDNDVDAFRHAYTSGVFTQELGDSASEICGYLQELSGNGSSRSNSPDSKNMDLWNNSIGRKYGKIAKSKSELAALLKKALEKGELILSPDDARKFLGKISQYFITPDKPIFVIQEEKTGRNNQFLDLLSGELMSREEFVLQIQSGQYPGYHIASISDILTPVSNPNAFFENNLG